MTTTRCFRMFTIQLNTSKKLFANFFFYMNNFTFYFFPLKLNVSEFLFEARKVWENFYRIHRKKSSIQWRKNTRGTKDSLPVLPSSLLFCSTAIIPHRNFTIFLTYTARLQWNVVGNFSSTVLNLCKLLCWANKIKKVGKKKMCWNSPMFSDVGTW